VYEMDEVYHKFSPPQMFGVGQLAE
jgi:hypothetical protein